MNSKVIAKRRMTAKDSDEYLAAVPEEQGAAGRDCCARSHSLAMGIIVNNSC
jgi:hypothetical protein